MVKHKQKPLLAAAAIAVVVAVVVGFVAIPPMTVSAQPNQIAGTIKLVDDKGKVIQNGAPEFSFTQNGQDVDNANVVSTMTASFNTAGSAVPVKDWTITGIARLKVQNLDAITLNLKLTGTTPSISNEPIPMRDSRCEHSTTFAQSHPCDYSMTIHSIPLRELAYGSGKVSYFYTGPVKVDFVLTSAVLTVNFEDGQQKILYAAGGAGAQAKPSVTFGTINLQATAEQQEQPVVVVDGFGVASGSVVLEEP